MSFLSLLLVLLVVVFLVLLELWSWHYLARKLLATTAAPKPVSVPPSTAHRLITEVEDEMGKLQNVPSQSITLIAAKLAALRATVI